MTSYVRRGSGSPLVLVHGLGSRWECWEPMLDELAEHHDVIAVDLPGFGHTRLENGVQPGPRGYAHWLADFLAELDVKQPHVAGNSMGGGIALELGRAGVASRVTAFSPIGFWGTPGRIWCQTVLTSFRSIGKLAAPALGPIAGTAPGRAALLGVGMARPSKVSTADTVLAARGLIESSGFPAARNSFSTYTFTEGEDLGALTEIPVTIAWGTRDLILPHRPQSARARALMPFAHHVDLVGLGHVPFSDDPELCVQTLLKEPE